MENQTNWEFALDREVHANMRFDKLNRDFEAQFQLSLVQWYILKAIRMYPAINLLKLAAAIGVSSGSLSVSIARLEKKGVIFTCEDPKDSRKLLISLDRKGMKFLNDVSQFFSENKIESFANLPRN